jgi:hypothetical protein
MGTDRCIPFFIVPLMCFWRVCGVPPASRVSVSVDSFCYGIRLPANRFPGSELMIAMCGYDSTIRHSGVRVMSSSFILPFASFFPRI